MDNHYHFIIQIIDQPLQKVMHRINNKYSKYYNHKNERTGHVFENRYKGIWVGDNKYLLSLLRYIHQNPVRAKICKKVNDYLWSSDLSYRENRQNGIIDIDFMLDMFTENRSLAIKAYKVFMDDEETEDSDTFENVLTIGEKSQLNTDIIVKETSRSRKSLDEILQEVVKDKAMYEDIKNGSRKRTLTIYKQEYIKKALALNYTMKEIGENISISESAVFKIHNR